MYYEWGTKKYFMLSNSEVLRHLEKHLPDFRASGAPSLLEGGLVNYIWRVNGDPKPVVVKSAPPFVATSPGIQLDPRRIIIEARMMTAFTAGGLLEDLVQENIRPPRLLNLDEEAHILVMEDLGDNPDFGAWLYREQNQAPSTSEIGRDIGTFIGALHTRSCGDQAMANAFDNSSIQHVRLENQYRRVREYCIRGGLPDAGALGQAAIAFGRLTLGPGLCAIMGDLWPRSILIVRKGIRVIDWEFAHYGRPAQDIGHLAAHLWMHMHRAYREYAISHTQAALNSFLESYRIALGSKIGALYGPSGERECSIHFGSEVLARTVGQFQKGYLYDGLAPEDKMVREAVEMAAAHLRQSAGTDTFSLLSAG